MSITWLFTIQYTLLAQESASSNYQVFYPETSSPTAVCMVIHALNLKPSKMQWIINELLNQGAIVVNVELWGHGNNPIPNSDTVQAAKRLSQFKQVTWAQWMDDTKPALKFITETCSENNLPKYFFGFSLGALVGSSISMEYDFEFDKYFLLAPTIKIKFWPKVFITLLSPFPNMVIRSKAPVDYRESKGTPESAYKALLRGVKKFKKEQPNLTNCLIIVDKKDRLISSKRLHRFAEQHNYSIAIIDKSLLDCQYCDVDHLVIDEESLGGYSNFVSDEISAFFK
jgi:esterase/lipase